MSELHRYFDGRVARPSSVTLAIRSTEIEILDENGASVAIWPFSHVRVADQNAVSGNYVLRLEPDHAARLEVSAGPQLQALLADRPELKRWRARERTGLLKAFVLWGAVGAAICALLYLGWTRASVLIADWIPPSWEDRIGQQVEQAWFPEPKRCSGPEGMRALQALGDRIWPDDGPGDGVKLFVIKQGDPNAFAVPGHRIVVFSGLIDRAKSPEMVAGVIAHELGHVELHHPMRGLIHQMGLGAALTLIFGDSTLAGMGQLALALSYSRDMEREADAEGIALLKKAGIRADGM
ncbi:MAG TPA: M48 family metallopeptidase, partial [Dongiaceae bacterium]|nr:M48 family metallopeptidase [Dongiaceae bacterium]